jgi:hypothetical protein
MSIAPFPAALGSHRRRRRLRLWWPASSTADHSRTSSIFSPQNRPLFLGQIDPVGPKISVAAGTDTADMENLALLGKGDDIKRKLQRPFGPLRRI